MFSEGRQRIVLEGAEMIDQRIDGDAAVDGFVINYRTKPDDLASMRLVPVVGENLDPYCLPFNAVIAEVAKLGGLSFFNLAQHIDHDIDGNRHHDRMVVFGGDLHETLQEAQVHGGWLLGDDICRIRELL